ncbi:MAG: ribosome maturation factor RimP [Peptococcaceae bacterium]|nr:ribosome maturation factor RimP [Peptococcaceae bacterium]
MNNVEKYVTEHYEPMIQENGYRLYHVEYQKAHQDHILRIFIECADDAVMDIDACEKISRACSDAFDNDPHFPVAVAYTLEVSSPGIERELYTPAHFQRYVGQKIRVRLFKAVDGKKEILAILEKADDQGITLNDDGHIIDLTYKEISKAQLYCDF